MALVRKILESVLTAGQTSVSFNDSDIPNSLIRVYASKADLFPVKQTLTGNVITIEYEAQSNNVGIALEIVKQGLDIVDDLTTEDNTKALSANQGYVLKGLIDNIVIPTVPENITDLDDVYVTDIANGQVLAWNSTTEEFENVNQSAGGEVVYSLDEKIIGKWIDGSDLYEKTILLPTVTTGTSYQHNISNVDKIWIQDIKATRNSTWFTSGHIFENASNNIAESFSIIANSTLLYTYVYGCTVTDCYVTLRYTKTS